MLLLKSIAWSALRALIRRRFPGVVPLSIAELHAWFERGDRPILLDARTPAEYQISHLPQAQRAGDLPTLLETLHRQGATPTTPIVVYCSVGYRSARLAQQLQQAGFRQVYNLEGSIFAWANQGYPVYQNDRPVQQVHPYNSVWGRLLKPDRRAPIG